MSRRHRAEGAPGDREVELADILEQIGVANVTGFEANVLYAERRRSGPGDLDFAHPVIDAPDLGGACRHVKRLPPLRAAHIEHAHAIEFE